MKHLPRSSPHLVRDETKSFGSIPSPHPAQDETKSFRSTPLPHPLDATTKKIKLQSISNQQFFKVPKL